jgi:hypothetical protein
MSQKIKTYQFSSQHMEFLGKLQQYLWLLIFSLCVIISVNKEWQSITENNESMNGHVKRKMTRQLVTDYTLCEYCTKFAIFVLHFVHFLWNDNVNFIQ